MQLNVNWRNLHNLSEHTNVPWRHFHWDMRKTSQSKQEGVAIEDAAPFSPLPGRPEFSSISKGADCSPVGQTTGKASLLSSRSTLSWCWSCCGGASGQGENAVGMEAVAGRYSTRIVTWKENPFSMILFIVTSTLSQGSLGFARVMQHTTWSP